MKYKIVLNHFDKKTGEMESTETLSTKDITEEKLAELVQNELSKSYTVCWYVKPRPKNFEKHFKE